MNQRIAKFIPRYSQKKKGSFQDIEFAKFFQMGGV